jgi:hypothetical protein
MGDKSLDYMEDNIKLTDFVSVEFLQKFQDAFSNSVGVAGLVTDENGVVWDSTTEYNFGLKLKKLQDEGKIKDLQFQVEFVLIPSFKDGQGVSNRKMSYIADFVYIDIVTNKKVICDAKGSEFNIDPTFKNKWKLLKYLKKDEHDIEYQIVIKYKDVWYNIENKEDKKVYKAVKAEKKTKKKNKKVK